MVDGVLTSCYASFDHDLAHFVMTPMQWFPEITEWIFGDDTGYQIYSSIAGKFGKWLVPYEQFLKY